MLKCGHVSMGHCIFSLLGEFADSTFCEFHKTFEHIVGLANLTEILEWLNYRDSVLKPIPTEGLE